MKKKVFFGIKLAVQIVLCILIAMLLVYNVCAMVQRAQGKKMPVVFGYSFAVVVSGSMQPEIQIGDVVVVKPQNTYQQSDVITYCDTRTGDYVTHRIILVTQDGKYLTKGDYNETDDKLAVPKEAVVGKVVDVWRGAGKAIRILQTPLGMFALIGGSLVFIVVLELIDRFCLKSKDGKDEQSKDKDKQEN